MGLMEHEVGGSTSGDDDEPSPLTGGRDWTFSLRGCAFASCVAHARLVR